MLSWWQILCVTERIFPNSSVMFVAYIDPRKHPCMDHGFIWYLQPYSHTQVENSAYCRYSFNCMCVTFSEFLCIASNLFFSPPDSTFHSIVWSSEMHISFSFQTVLTSPRAFVLIDWEFTLVELRLHFLSAAFELFWKFLLKFRLSVISLCSILEF